MIFTPTAVAGVWVLDSERRGDARGYFARTFCHSELAAHGLNFEVVQANTSFNQSAGVLRGLHWQAEPHAEIKLVRCVRGRIWDVAVDVRPDSPSYKQWFGVELSAENGRALYIPRGCAHGYLTLEEGCEVSYMVSAAYAPSHERGARWDDPAFGIEWPVAGRVTVSPRDEAHPPFDLDTTVGGR